MADSKELKPKSFRIDDETADRFKELSAQIGGNQQETLSKLIEAYEFQAGKAVLTEKKVDIEQFEKYVTALTRMFMGSLEDNQHITEIVRTEFDALLKSKDATIQDLQEQLTSAKQIKEEATAKAKKYLDDYNNLHNQKEESDFQYRNKIANLQVEINDKISLIDFLKNTSNDLRTKAENQENELNSTKQKYEQFATVSAELTSLKQIHEQTVNEKANLQKQIDQDAKQHQKAIEDFKRHEADALERAKEQAQFNMEKALFELEKNYQKLIEQLKEQKQTEVDMYQQKYLDLLEELKNQSKFESQEELKNQSEVEPQEE